MQEIVKRKKARIERDPSRVITQPYIPGDLSRVNNLLSKVLGLSDTTAKKILLQIRHDFSDRHRNLDELLLINFDKVAEYIPHTAHISLAKKMLIGSYFTKEYSIESAALFNPSIVLHPDQSNVPEGGARFAMSLRATGEGHISSIVFRSGIINSDFSLMFDSVSEFVETPAMLHDPFYDNHLFCLTLQEMGAWNNTSQRILSRLQPFFTYQDLKFSIHEVYQEDPGKSDDNAINAINWLANSNYKIKFNDKTQLSERVIYPVSENESKGIEDARFVQFTKDDGKTVYYATYTAYNGQHILPQLIKTKDFMTFNISTLNGNAIQNKGLALFPRKINGLYAMLSRQDGENNHIMFSDNLHFWHTSQIIQEPLYPWEFIQIGNCGSPIELEEGWLVLTHGVGPMRQYCISAVLLDLNEPTKIVARLREPLLSPNEEERVGYVPNVLYTCGAILFNDHLIIPYAMSDITTRIAMVELKSLLKKMKSAG